MIYEELPEYLRNRIEIQASGCWLWTGSMHRSGYGQIWFQGKYLGSAHRGIYETMVGEIPFGLDIDHLCRVRSCVNPDHLEPGSRRENIMRGRGLAATNAAKTHCLHGHPFAGDNVIRYFNSKGPGTWRACRECARQKYVNRSRKQAHA